MGVNFLWQHFLCPAKRSSWKCLHDLNGTTIGVDLSYWLHMALAQDTVAMKLEYDRKNQIAPEEILSFLSKRYEICSELGIRLVFVIEGNEPDLKKDVARILRQQTKAKAEEEYKLFMKKCEDYPSKVSDTDRTKFESTLKKLVSRSEKLTSFVVNWMRDRNIAFLGAPYEGEWQLVQMEKDKRINAIIANDGDCVILGADRVIFDINFTELKFREFNRSEASIVHMKDKMQFPLMKYSKCNYPLISCLLGNDYIRKVHGIGISKIHKVLDSLDPAKTWNMNDLKCAMGTIIQCKLDQKYWDKFQLCCNLIRYCPVLSRTGQIVPLNLVENGDDWSILIGFDACCGLLPKECDYTNASKFVDCTFLKGYEDLLSFQPIHYNADNNPDCIGELLPPFANVKLPIVSMPNYVLHCWIAARLGFVPQLSRVDLEICAEKLREAQKVILAPCRVPKTYNNWVIGDVLTNYTDDKGFCETGWYEILNDFRCVKKLTDDDLQTSYIGQKNIFQRVVNLIRGGNVRIETIAVAKMRAINGDGSPIYVIRITVIPSMYSSTKNANIEDTSALCEGYIVYIAFGKTEESNELEILEYPFTCCGCYDGRKPCSHQLAARCLIYIVQNFSKEDSFHFFNIKSPVEVQNKLRPIEFFDQSNSNLKRLRLKKES